MQLKIIQKIPAEVKVLLLTLALGLLTWYLYRAHAENAALRDALELLEGSFVEEREANRLEFERQQEVIDSLIDNDSGLREDLEELDRTKADINRKADEKETDIRGIRDVDSLRNEVARHYRR